MAPKKPPKVKLPPPRIAKQIDDAVAFWRDQARPAIDEAILDQMRTIATVLDAAIVLGRPRDLEAIRLAHHAILGSGGDITEKRRRVLGAVTDAILRWDGHQGEAAKRLLGHLKPYDPAFRSLDKATIFRIFEQRRSNTTAPLIAARLSCECGAFDYGTKDVERARQHFAKV